MPVLSPLDHDAVRRERARALRGPAVSSEGRAAVAATWLLLASLASAALCGAVLWALSRVLAWIFP